MRWDYGDPDLPSGHPGRPLERNPAQILAVEAEHVIIDEARILAGVPRVERMDVRRPILEETGCRAFAAPERLVHLLDPEVASLVVYAPPRQPPTPFRRCWCQGAMRRDL
jgi:hypothetical protein